MSRFTLGNVSAAAALVLALTASVALVVLGAGWVKVLGALVAGAVGWSIDGVVERFRR